MAQEEIPRPPVPQDDEKPPTPPWEQAPVARPRAVRPAPPPVGPPKVVSARPVRVQAPLTVGKRPCFDCNYILSPYQEFCPHCGAFQPAERLPLLGLDQRTIAAFLLQEGQRPAAATTLAAAGWVLLALVSVVTFLVMPGLAAFTKLILSPLVGALLWWVGRQVALYYLFYKWIPYIQTNRYKTTFLGIELQLKKRLGEIEKKLQELDGLRERTLGFNPSEGQNSVQATLGAAETALREKQQEFGAQIWQLQLCQWFNRISGIGVRGNQDGLTNDVERVEELTYIGHHYLNQLKKEKQLAPTALEALKNRVKEGMDLLKKIQEVVVTQEAEKLVQQVRPLDGGMPEELSVEGRISALSVHAAQVSLESFTDVVERLDREYFRIGVERKISQDTKNLLRE